MSPADRAAYEERISEMESKLQAFEPMLEALEMLLTNPTAEARRKARAALSLASGEPQ